MICKLYYELLIVLAFTVIFQVCIAPEVSIDARYHLVTATFGMAKRLFMKDRNNYDSLKIKSLSSMDTFLDLVGIMNNEMARELRSAIVKFYKIKYFHDFTNYVISMEEMIEITEHCLIEPKQKLAEIRERFHQVIHNFEDARNFNSSSKCLEELPDEVAAAHCVLHQAVLFNETMHDSLITIVEIKTQQHAQDMNSSLNSVQACLYNFVPHFYEQLLIDAYTDSCGYMRVVNASISDLLKDNWKNNETHFQRKWSPLVNLFKEKMKSPDQNLHQPLLMTLFAANLSSGQIKPRRDATLRNATRHHAT